MKGAFKMKEIGRMLGTMEYDNLISGLNPPLQTGGGILAGVAAEYQRGTVLAKSAANNQLYILGSAAAEGDQLTPDCILCEDITVEAGTPAPAVVYLAGCFNPTRVKVAECYTLTEADKDALRLRGIIFKAMAE